MSGLKRRLSVLEAGQGGFDLSHLSDAELEARLVQVCEEIEAHGATFAGD